MQYFVDALKLLFGADGELRQILGVTLQMSLFSTVISVSLGVMAGIWIGCNSFKGKRAVMSVVQTFMGMPSVVAGLIVFLLLSRKGPLGSLNLLFSVSAMVIAQVILILPVVISLTAAFVHEKAPKLFETTRGVALTRAHEYALMLYECRGQFMSVALNAFGRSISEVGAVMLVGGNIAHKTRVMTTAIMLETNKGNFEFAIALGLLLLLISLVINALAHNFKEGFHARNS